MKKLLIIISILCIGIFSYAQLPSPTSHQTLNNGEQMGVFRGKLNTNGINTVNYLTLVRDTINNFSDRIKLLEAGGIGGSTYTFSNGLTLTGGSNARLGGTLLTSTAINTNGLDFQIFSRGTIPTFGSYADFLFGQEQVTLGSRVLDGGGINDITSGSYLELPATGLMKLRSGINSDVWSEIYNDAEGLHIYRNGSPLGGQMISFGAVGGLQYGDDYRTGFTQYSLVDKGYVDALIGSGTVTTTGTPLANQLAFFSTANVITGGDGILRNAYGGLQLMTTTGASLIIRPGTEATGISIGYDGNTTSGINITNDYEEVFKITGDTTFFPKYAGWTVRPWNTFSINGGLDTAHTENAGERLVAKLRPLVFHLYDRKIINGVPEVSWYHSNGTKEYGINHLDPWKQVEALMGNIEMLERWLFRTQILVFILFITVGFLIKYLRKRKVKDLGLRLDTIEQRLNHPMNQPLYHVKPNRK